MPLSESKCLRIMRFSCYRLVWLRFQFPKVFGHHGNSRSLKCRAAVQKTGQITSGVVLLEITAFLKCNS